MEMRYRSMTCRDYSACLRLLPHKHLYEPSLWEALPSLWQQLQEQGKMRGSVVENERGKILCFGCSVFLDERFRNRYRTSGQGMLPREVLRELRHGDPSIVLTPEEVRYQNTIEGLNLLLLHPTCADDSLNAMDYIEAAYLSNQAFIEAHTGYYLKEILACVDEKIIPYFLAGGFSLSETFKTYPGLSLVSITREQARQNPFLGVAPLMSTPRARFFFSEREQELLEMATQGYTDEELATRLCLSLPAIKKRWAGIYSCVAENAPLLLTGGEEARAGEENRLRGAEKRRHLLRYLNTHPEERRPVLSRRQQEVYRSRATT